MNNRILRVNLNIQGDYSYDNRFTGDFFSITGEVILKISEKEYQKIKNNKDLMVAKVLMAKCRKIIKKGSLNLQPLIALQGQLEIKKHKLPTRQLKSQ